MYDAFISYSRADNPFPAILAETLTTRQRPGGLNQAVSMWFDKNDIEPASEFRERIRKGIELSRVIIVLFSNNYLASEICYSEVSYAAELGKPIIPVLLTAHTDVSTIDSLQEKRRTEKGEWATRPKAASIELFRNLYQRQSFIEAFSLSQDDLAETVYKTMYLDLSNNDGLRKWSNRALEWQSSKFSSWKLILGRDITEAEQWRDNALSKQLIIEQYILKFIQASRLQQRRGQRIGTLFVSIVAAIFALISVIAVQLYFQSQTNLSTANVRGTEVSNQANIASTNEKQAYIQSTLVAEQRDKAESLRLVAEANAIEQNPYGNAETAALLTLNAIRKVETQQGINTLTKLAPRLRTKYLLGNNDTDCSVKITQSVANHSIAYSPDGRLLYALCKDSVLIWNTQSGTRFGKYSLNGEKPIGLQSFDDPDHLFIITDKYYLLLNAKSMNIKSKTELTNDNVVYGTISPKGNHVAIIDTLGNGKIVDASTGNNTRTLSSLRRMVTAAFSKDGSKLFTLSNVSTGGVNFSTLITSTLQIWNVSDTRLIAEIPLNIALASTLDISPDEKFAAVGSAKSQFYIIDLTSRQIVKDVDTNVPSIGLPVKFSRDGTSLFTLHGSTAPSSPNVVIMWDLKSGKQISTFSGNVSAPVDLSINSYQKEFSTISLDGTIRIWNELQTASLIKPQIDIEPIGPSFPKLSPNGKYFGLTNGISVYSQFTYILSDALIFDSQSGAQVLDLSQPGSNIIGLAFSPDNTSVLTYNSPDFKNSSSILTTWDIRTKQIITSFTVPNRQVRKVTYTPNGKYVVIDEIAPLTRPTDIAWDRSASVNVRNAKTGELIKQFSQGELSVTNWKFVNEGKEILVIGSSITLWNLDTMTKKFEIRNAYNEPFDDAVISNDQTLLIGTTTNRNAKQEFIVWQLDNSQVIHSYTADAYVSVQKDVRMGFWQNNPWIAFGQSNDVYFKLWNRANPSGESLTPSLYPNQEIIASTSKYFITHDLGMSGSINVYDLSTGLLARQIKIGNLAQPTAIVFGILVGMSPDDTRHIISPDERYILVPDIISGTLNVWNIEDGSLFRQYSPPSSSLGPMLGSFSSDGNYLSLISIDLANMNLAGGNSTLFDTFLASKKLTRAFVSVFDNQAEVCNKLHRGLSKEEVELYLIDDSIDLSSLCTREELSDSMYGSNAPLDAYVPTFVPIPTPTTIMETQLNPTDQKLFDYLSIKEDEIRLSESESHQVFKIDTANQRMNGMRFRVGSGWFSPDKYYGDFIMKSSISGTGLCGFEVRSAGTVNYKIVADFNRRLISIIRTMDGAEVASDGGSFDVVDNSSSELVIVVIRDRSFVFVNGKPTREFSFQSKYGGGAGLIGLLDPGFLNGECTFDNMKLWELNPMTSEKHLEFISSLFH